MQVLNDVPGTSMVLWLKPLALRASIALAQLGPTQQEPSFHSRAQAPGTSARVALMREERPVTSGGLLAHRVSECLGETRADVWGALVDAETDVRLGAIEFLRQRDHSGIECRAYGGRSEG